MSSYCGNDLLKVFSDLQVDLRSLSPIVVKAWFDTDCKDTQNLLNWMCCSLTNKNYVSPLEAAEYNDLECILDDETCLKELKKLGPEFDGVFENNVGHNEMSLLEDEIGIFEEENETLDELIALYENFESNLSLELTRATSKEIHTHVNCAKAQNACIQLSERLDQTNSKIRERLVKYEPDSHFVNFVGIQEYQKRLEHLKSGLAPIMELDRMYLEQSDDDLTDALDVARERILHSYQLFLVNKVEIDKLNGIFHFLIKMDLSEIVVNHPSNRLNIEAKEVYKQRLCEILDTNASNHADHHVSQSRLRYLNKELESYRSKSESTSKLLDIVLRFMSYYHLTNALQYEEKKDIQSITRFYQNMSDYINNDLEKCRHRIVQMDKIIHDYQVYLEQPNFEKMKLISAIAEVLSSDCFDLKSTLEAVAKFKNELKVLEQQTFVVDFYQEREKILKRMDDMSIIQSFLKSGPTDCVVLIPMKLQHIWLELETHLKKESASVAQAVQIPSIARKNLTKTQTYMKQLWMNFITNPTKIEIVLKQAEANFNEKTAKHFV